ncbi:MAG: PglZ domain-containing protein [Bacteroidetes bacterium]|nr:PglZ domain-containing protein [Bacteroidota bacterium]
MSNNISILWADDEIELLKPHLLFLKNKGYDVTPVTSGVDAIEEIKTKNFDLIFLDENMPGISGLETLSIIKEMKDIPVVMITKSEEEYIMEEAIGSKIADYLIKPVNPNQILSSIKKLTENKRLESEKANHSYQQEFRNIGMTLGDKLSYEEWVNVYKKLVYWELELESVHDNQMGEIIAMQKKEANNSWKRYIAENYLKILKNSTDTEPLLSHQLIKNKVVPLLDGEDPVFFILIDNLRYDQWRVIQPILADYCRLEDDGMYMSILPTTTHYCRNALFAGLPPSEIERKFPNLWSNDEEEGGKNLHEEEFLREQLIRLKKDVKMSYTKITNLDSGKAMVENISNMFQNKLNVIVYNFVDMLSHARTEMGVIKELAEDEPAYRSITRSWFIHSPLFEAIKRITQKNVKIVITTDHGSIRVKEPVKIIGDRSTTTNLRYKQGRNLNYDAKQVFEIRNPADGFLPKPHVSSTFAFCYEDDFFVYPNNYNYHVNLYKNTFQHGGISLEEMLIPVAILSNKK